MSVLDIIILILSAVEYAQELLSTQIEGWTVWSLILLSWIPLSCPIALLFTRLVYVRHGRPFDSREKQALALGALGGWATLAISMLYILPLSLLLIILTRIFKSRPINFMASWLMLPVRLLATKIKDAAVRIKQFSYLLAEKMIDRIFPNKTS